MMRNEYGIELLDGVAGIPIAARIVIGMTVFEVDQAISRWSPFLNETRVINGRRAEHEHWDWRKKVRAIRRTSGFVVAGVAVEDEVEALVLWDEMHERARLPLPAARGLVYVNFISTAP
ncbi:MAG: hypothetical protein SFX74_03085 [Fimbriimonadaceae bacterium]|nr:hypothetical protein [Fimbriimonadaceae bacterium]